MDFFPYYINLFRILLHAREFGDIPGFTTRYVENCESNLKSNDF